MQADVLWYTWTEDKASFPFSFWTWTPQLRNQFKKIRPHLRAMLVCFVLEYYYETSQDSDTH